MTWDLCIFLFFSLYRWHGSYRFLSMFDNSHVICRYYIYCEFQWHAAPEVRIHLCVSSRLLWSKGPLMPILGIAEENVVCEPFGYCVAWCEDSYPITTWRSYLFAWRGIHSPLTDSWIGYLLPHGSGATSVASVTLRRSKGLSVVTAALQWVCNRSIPTDHNLHTTELNTNFTFNLQQHGVQGHVSWSAVWWPPIRL